MICAIAKSVKEIVPEYSVYINSTKQNTDLPSVFVNIGKADIESEISGIRKITIGITISGIISNDAKTEEKCELMSRILTGLEYIKYKDRLIRYIDKSAETDSESRVIISARAVFRVRAEDTEEIMKTLYNKIFISTELKGE